MGKTVAFANRGLGWASSARSSSTLLAPAQTTPSPVTKTGARELMPEAGVA